MAALWLSPKTLWMTSAIACMGKCAECVQVSMCCLFALWCLMLELMVDAFVHSMQDYRLLSQEKKTGLIRATARIFMVI